MLSGGGGGLSNLDQTFVYFLILLSETEQAFTFQLAASNFKGFFCPKWNFTVLFYLAEADIFTQKKDKHR